MTNNKLTMLLTRGISGSGKSYWTKQFLQDNPNFREVNRDEIRISLFGQENMWKGDEKKVTIVQEGLIKSLLGIGHSLVISDTNLNNKIVNRLIQLAASYEAKVEWKDFTDVSLNLCLERDAKRKFPVGADVIKRQYYKYVMKNEFYREPYLKPQDENLPVAVIFDVDGTLTLGPENRSPYDMDKVRQDKPNQYVMAMLGMYIGLGVRIFIFSGRELKAYTDTVDWLAEHCPNTVEAFKAGILSLHMRPNNQPGINAERDDIVKMRLYTEQIKDKYHVVAVFDDRKQVVVNVWGPKGFGLPLFRVGDPEADF